MSWRERAACRGMDVDLFFPQKGEPVGHLRAICGRCPVQKECLDYALDAGEKFGWFGNTSERQRRLLRRDRPATPNRCSECGAPLPRNRRSCAGACEDRRATRLRQLRLVGLPAQGRLPPGTPTEMWGVQ